MSKADGFSLELHLLIMLWFLSMLFQQIELHESEEVTVLVANLAWNDSSTSFFAKAIQTYEIALYQVF